MFERAFIGAAVNLLLCYGGLLAYWLGFAFRRYGLGKRAVYVALIAVAAFILFGARGLEHGLEAGLTVLVLAGYAAFGKRAAFLSGLFSERVSRQSNPEHAPLT